jgi:Zn-dependent peptidase ImmA (M78 family)
LAHHVLHEKFYSEFQGETYDDWCQFYLDHSNDIPRTEWQANRFAGAILMPATAIKNDVKEYMTRYQSYDADLKLERISYELARKYIVSLKSAQYRIEKYMQEQSGKGQ